MASFWFELKRRRVIRATAVYAVVGWVLIQVSDVVVPTLLLPPWVSRLVTFLLLLGLPIVIVLAWAYDLTPEGLKLTADADKPTSRHPDNEPAVGEAIAAPAERTDHAGTSADPSIAVLPFANVSADPDNEYFSDGISEELINTLSRIDGWRVAARTSCFYFKGKDEKIQKIGAELGVNTLLEGSVRTTDNHIRVTAQLINVSDGYQLWSNTYNHERNNLLQVQDEIARAIVEALKGRILSSDETSRLTTSNEAAYQYYLRGRFLWQRRDTRSIVEGIELLEEAIGTDPGFSDAHAALAAAYHKVPLYVPDADAGAMQRLAETAAREALRLNPNSGEASAILGSILANSHRYEAADEAFNRALKSQQSTVTGQHWYAVFLMNTGRLNKALMHIQCALDLDRLNGAIFGTCGNINYSLGRTEEAVESYESAMQLGWSDAANAFLGAIHLSLGNREKARSHFQAGRFAAESVPPHLIDAILDAGAGNSRGRAATGEKILASASAGEITAALAFRLCALQGLTHVFELPFETEDIPGDALGTIWHPPAAKLRSDPRFPALMERFGLPAAWRSSTWPDGCHPTDDGFTCN